MVSGDNWINCKTYQPQTCPYPLVEVNEMLTVYSFSVHRELKYYNRGRRYNTLTCTLVCCSRVVAVACSTGGTRKCIQVETERVGRGGGVGRVCVTWSNSVAGFWRSPAWPRIHLHGCSSQQVQHNNFHLGQQWRLTGKSKLFDSVAENHSPWPAQLNRSRAFLLCTVHTSACRNPESTLMSKYCSIVVFMLYCIFNSSFIFKTLHRAFLWVGETPLFFV